MSYWQYSSESSNSSSGSSVSEVEKNESFSSDVDNGRPGPFAENSPGCFSKCKIKCD